MRLRPLLGAAVALVLVGGDLALSSWSAWGDGAAGARATTLAAPTALTGRRVPTGVDLTWTPSSSAFATGQVVLRSATVDGAYSQVGAPAAAATSFVDTTARAGSWYYAVASTAGAWRSPSSALWSADPVYYVRATASFAGTGCPAAGTTQDLLQGHVAPTGNGTGYALGTVTLCTDTFSAGQTLPAGTTTVNAYLVNNLKQTDTCTVDLTLLHNGTALATGSGVVAPGGTTMQALSWPMTTPAVAFADGDRLAVQLVGRARSNATGNNCTSTTLYGDGSLAPSNVTFPG